MTNPKPFNLTPRRRAALEEVRDGRVYKSGLPVHQGGFFNRAGDNLSREVSALHQARLVQVGRSDVLKNWMEITDAGLAALENE